MVAGRIVSDEIKVIRLADELEIGRRAEVRAALHLEGTERAVLLDFEEVRYADSTALTELLRFRAEADRSGIPLALLIGSRQFRRLIQYAGLAEVFAIFDDRRAALLDLHARMR